MIINKYLSIFFVCVLFILLTMLNVNSILLYSTIISLVTIWLVVSFIVFYKANWVVVIYLGYQLFILSFPLVYIFFTYDDKNKLDYLSYRGILEIDLVYSNLYILFFFCVVIFFISLFNRVKSIPLVKPLKYPRINNFYSVLCLLVISYSMKFYLISIGAWFMLDESNLSSNAFASTAKVLEQLDVLVLLFFLYLKINKGKITKKELLLTILVFIISFSFAVISTSKEKMLIVAIPVVLIFFVERNWKTIIGFCLVGFLCLQILFEFTKYLRYADEVSTTTVVAFFDRDTSHQDTIFADDIVRRLDYQFVISKVFNFYPDFPDTYKDNYLDNIYSLIPRLFWPGKPSIGIDTNQLGRELGVISSSDYRTSIGITPIGASYYDFGVIGIPLIAFLIALLLTLTSKMLVLNTWTSFVLKIMLSILLARHGTYMYIVPLYIQTFIIFYIFSSLLQNERQRIEI